MRLGLRILYSLSHNGLGAPQARPPEPGPRAAAARGARSGAGITGPRERTGVPTARSVRRGVGWRGGSAGAKPPGSKRRTDAEANARGDRSQYRDGDVG